MKEKARILIIDDENSIRMGFGGFLQSRGYAVLEAENGAQGLLQARNHSPDLVLLDLKLPDIEGIELLRQIRAENEFVVVIMITAFGTIEVAVRALKLGAENFLTKPFDPESLLIVIEHALEIHRLRRQKILNEFHQKGESEDLYASQSNKMLKFQELARIVARDPTVTVLLTGETGTGKGKWARWIHDHSERKDKPFVEINCAGLSKELLESELFGFEKGAFTGAVNNKSGLLEVASGGTMFLDEISEMELTVQAKVLKVLEDSRFRRLGSVQERHTDVRLITATNKNLEKAVKENHFREDLFYRLNVMALELPPLRERPEDIRPLAEFFLKQMARKKSAPVPVLTEDAIHLLESYAWPGNLRELRNLLERAFLLKKDSELDVGLFPIHPSAVLDAGVAGAYPMVPLKDIELKHIRQVLSAVNNNYRKAAQILGINRNTLYNRLKEKPEEA